jgi:hypothetical protein
MPVLHFGHSYRQETACEGFPTRLSTTGTSYRQEALIEKGSEETAVIPSLPFLQ